MRISEANVDAVSAALYTGCSFLLALGFFAVTLTGDYSWVARLGGAGWVFALAMVILMPTVPGLIRERVTGEKAAPMVHDHEAMLRGETNQRTINLTNHEDHGRGTRDAGTQEDGYDG